MTMTRESPWGQVASIDHDPLVGEVLLRWAPHVNELAQRRLKAIFEQWRNRPVNKNLHVYRTTVLFFSTAFTIMPKCLEVAGFVKQARELEGFRYSDQQEVTPDRLRLLQSLNRKIGMREREYMGPVPSVDERRCDDLAREALALAGVPFFCQSINRYSSESGERLGALAVDALAWNALRLQALAVMRQHDSTGDWQSAAWSKMQPAALENFRTSVAILDYVLSV